jgi:hypothetical protein
MKRIILYVIVGLMFGIPAMAIGPDFNPYDQHFIPGDAKNISISTGGYIFVDLANEVYYLFDSRAGKLWQLIGKIKDPQHFIPVKYEDTKGNLMIQPETILAEQFPGRFAICNVHGDRIIVLDTTTGNVWTLQGTPEKPIKLTLIPRKD